MDYKTSSSKISLILTALLLSAVIPISGVGAAPPEESEFFYGVEYDWTSVNTDLDNFTGLDLPEIFGEVMGAADDAGLNMIIGQLLTGSSNVYIHHSEDITPQTIKDYNQNDVSVWSRTTDVTIRHGGVSDAIFNTDWSETTFGSQTTSFDVDLSSSLQNLVNVDIVFEEYLDDSYNLIGADMLFSMHTSTSAALEIDASFEGDGEVLPIDFEVGFSFGYSITDSSSQWRLESPDSVYVDVSQDDEYYWDCDGCGNIAGDYDGSVDYSVTVTGIPTEEFGLDSGEFDVEISDQITKTDQDYTSNDIDIEFDFQMGDSLNVDLGDGVNTQVETCESCPPGNPIMFAMMGHVIAGTGEDFADEIADEFSEQLSDSLIDIFDIESDDDDDYYYSNYITCDDGEMRVDNQLRVDCYDGSDEPVLQNTLNMGPDGQGYTYISINEYKIDDVNTYNEYDEHYWSDFVCSDGEVISWGEVKDDYQNCADGSDEYEFYYGECYNTITEEYSVNDNEDSCAESFSYYEETNDEGELEIGCLNDYTGEDFLGMSENECQSFVWIEEEFTCSDGSMIPFDQVGDGNSDCLGNEDEGYDIYQVVTNVIDSEGTVVGTRTLDYCLANDCYFNPGNSWSFTQSYYIGGSIDAIITEDYGIHDYCAITTISKLGDESWASIDSDMYCTSVQVGPYLYNLGFDFNDDENGDDVIEYSSYAAHYGGGGLSDTTMEVEITNPLGEVVYSKTSGFEDVADSDAQALDEGSISIQGEGVYCISSQLVFTETNTVLDSRTDCEEYSTEGQPSEKIEKIFKAFADSGLGEVLEQFGQNLQDRLETIEPLEEFPYNDGEFSPMWSNQHAAIVGVGLYVMDEDGTYTMAGPDTVGISSEVPTKMSIRYLTGLDASNAANSMEDADELGEIVDLEQHDLTQIKSDLEAAGIDTSGLDLSTPNAPDIGNDAEQAPSDTEDKVDDDGLLPFASPFSVIAVVALAGIIFGNRKDE